MLADVNGDDVSIKQDRFGDKTLCEHITVPTFDSGDREWDSYREYVLVYNGKDIDVIAFNGGYNIAHINVYRKMILGVELFKQYFGRQNYPTGASDSIKWIDEDLLQRETKRSWKYLYVPTGSMAKKSCRQSNCAAFIYRMRRWEEKQWNL